VFRSHANGVTGRMNAFRGSTVGNNRHSACDGTLLFTRRPPAAEKLNGVFGRLSMAVSYDSFYFEYCYQAVGMLSRQLESFRERSSEPITARPSHSVRSQNSTTAPPGPNSPGSSPASSTVDNHGTPIEKRGGSAQPKQKEQSNRST
jgi:hypothetical protein